MIHAKSDTCLSKKDTEVLNLIIQIQNSMIESYKSQLSMIRETNNFDVDELVDSILHTNEDTSQFKNAVLFMKRKLDTILENLL